MFKAAGKKILLLSFCLAFGAFAQAGLAANYKDDAAQGLADGAGIWINLWNYPQTDLDSYFRELKEHGVRNIFLQTSRSNTAAIVNPDKLGEIIEAAHRQNMRVIAWSFAELVNPDADAEKMVSAAQYTSPGGEHVDGAAPNLEKNLEAWRIEKYARGVRSKLGPNYPLIAVVYSPLNKCFEVKRISWPLLAQYFDTIAPMIYWNSKYEKIEPYDYTVRSIKRIRELAEKPDIEISAIGDGMGSDAPAIHEFMRACRDSETTGISLYPNQKITREQLSALAKHTDYIKANARYRLAAFRDYARQGSLNSPQGLDPSQAISRRDFYKLIVRQMYPAMTLPGKNEQKTDLRPHSQVLPSQSECRQADGLDALQILVNLGLVADMSDLSSIQGVLDSPIYPQEAMSLIASILELDQQKLGITNKKSRRFDRWFVPGAQAESLEEERAKNRPLNYLDASQMVHQASSALR